MVSKPLNHILLLNGKVRVTAISLDNLWFHDRTTYAYSHRRADDRDHNPTHRGILGSLVLKLRGILTALFNVGNSLIQPVLCWVPEQSSKARRVCEL